MTPSPPPPIQRNFPVIPDTSRSVQDEFRTIRNMNYDLQQQIQNLNANTISVNVVLAKLTVGGTNGSMTVVNGAVTAYTAPT